MNQSKRMNRIRAPFLDAACLSGFSKYKYAAVDTSPISRYICHPYWNFVVQFVPRWIAPNVLTLVGFLLTASSVLLLAYYDADVGGAGVRGSIPRFVFYACSFNQFTAYTLDGIDGKQARRTGTSSPLGELFDHGLDSWTVSLQVIALFSVFGADTTFGAPAVRIFACLATTLCGFYLTHWEKYNTGVLYLPWSYDVSQLAVALVFFLTGYYGTEFWHFYIDIPFVGPLASSRPIELALYVGSTLFVLPVSLYNMYKSSRKRKPLSLIESLRPLTSFILLLAISYLWIWKSPGMLRGANVRLFSVLVGVVFSNFTSRLVIIQMSSARSETVSIFLYPFAAAMCVSLLIPELENVAIGSVTLLLLSVHLYFGWAIVAQLADFFFINTFSTSKRVRAGDAVNGSAVGKGRSSPEPVANRTRSSNKANGASPLATNGV